MIDPGTDGGPARRRVRPSLHAALTAELRGMIVRHELKPGERIGEARLSAALGVSRTPLREALKALAAERLVALEPFRGAVVAELPAEEVAHLFEAQAMIEAEAARHACDRATEAELAAFEAGHARMLRFFARRDRKAYFAVNQALHRALVAMAHNPVVARAHDAIMVQVERARFAALHVGQRWEGSVAQHEAILAALKARDATAAADQVRRHVAGTGETILAAMAARGARRPSAAP